MSELGVHSRAPVLITVHGTFAAHVEDDGELWWQRGSRFGQALLQHLESPDAAVIRPFHWTGDNSTRARRIAARALQQVMFDLEAEERPYHLIGHSHGGNVIRDSLALTWGSSAGVAGRRPKWLRSVNTIGTPFLSYEAPLVARLLAPLWFGISVLGLLAAVYAVGRVKPLADAVLASRSLIGFAQFAVVVSIPLIAPALAAYPAIAAEVGRERAAARRAVLDMGSRWLVLWSTDDEAIAGLGALVQSDIRLLRSARPGGVSDPIPGVDNQYRGLIKGAKQPLRWLNRLMAPAWDGLINGALRGAAGGVDFDGVRLATVTASPIAEGPRPEDAPLPEDVSTELRRVAEDSLREAAGTLRPLLQNTLTPSSVMDEEAAAALSGLGSVLVHSAYFESPEVVTRVAQHITAVGHAPGDGSLSVRPSLKSEFLGGRSWPRATVVFLANLGLAAWALVLIVTEIAALVRLMLAAVGIV